MARIEDVPAHPWTKDWWGTLPGAYRAADAVQNATIGGFPMLRYMDGVGRIAGRIREISDAMWGGVYTDPARVPDGAALRWLAQMLGVRAVPGEDEDALRARLSALVAGGRPAVGTRGTIAETARAYLTGDRQVNVVPSRSAPHRIVILVRAEEVPGNDLAAFVAKVKASGAIPAGHEIVAQVAAATWDQWEAAAGTTWAEVEGNAPTWAAADSLGVVLEEEI